ncbi:MAG: amidohydrolase family protein [Verrucomicrobiae bacterium]|nr:amidohydrolase family protein [Verrucomicrobiae bacterium]
MPTRRTFLASTAALGATLAAPVARGEGYRGRIIDCHTHFYDPTRPEGVPWPAKNTPLYRRVLPDDWMAVAGPHGVTETVVVEASPWVEDNQFLLDLAAKDKRLLGIIGNLDPTAPDFAANAKRFAANPLYRGIRISSAKAAEPANEAAYQAGLKVLADAGLVLDINGGPLTPGIAAKLAVRHPDLTIIVNHCGNPGDAARPLSEDWKAGVKAAGACPNVFCKVSALVEGVKGEPGKAPADPDYYLPILTPLWEAFGPDRLVYGSNWPVSDRGAPYGTVIDIVKAYFGGKGPEVAEKYFWKNSATAYRWKERTA